MIREIQTTREQFAAHMLRCQKYVESWPAWKLETRASQYPREAVPTEEMSIPGAEKGTQ